MLQNATYVIYNSVNNCASWGSSSISPLSKSRRLVPECTRSNYHLFNYLFKLYLTAFRHRQKRPLTGNLNEKISPRTEG